MREDTGELTACETPSSVLTLSAPRMTFKEWSFPPSPAVVIYHLKNHYAPLYALREWVTSSGGCVRQLLTAR
jgi:hypothetical protein